MSETSTISDKRTEQAQEYSWSQQLQRRVLRLLIQHDRPLLRSQFHLFFASSTLPSIPLLQKYDRYIKLQTLSNELLDDIMPRIRRQLSLQTNHLHLREEAPTRGTIDWNRTLERSWQQLPGQPALLFESRIRQRSMETPENLLTVAILLAFRQEVQQAIGEFFDDEALNVQERQTLVGADERVERELSVPYARLLKEHASKIDIQAHIQTIAPRLHRGPYRDLLAWWQHFTHFRIGRAIDKRSTTLSTTRNDEKTDAWLYELWIMLEMIHLLQQETAIQPQDMTIATDLLQCTFSWQKRRFRLIYNRQLDTSSNYRSTWEYGPATRPDYTIERETPLTVKHREDLIWREPSVILDAKYYLSGSDPTSTHTPIKKMLGDMELLGSSCGMLFFPLIAEPTEDTQITRTIQRREGHYQPSPIASPEIHLYQISPELPLSISQQRLRAILDRATNNLPERPKPVCQGTFLERRTVNAAGYTPQSCNILCPKPHIGPSVFDIVNRDRDCLKNPRICHVIGQPIEPPRMEET
ncbi:hypothetical protein [Ktedonospora formicarum]|uniref:Uncharacterized protein n=1 Tax=Ktedonospora formicarum TaxID=2778364 RepID=A0A8J3MXD4_9CHLR|nr:hypothetical protein [Ktedonospora formicarum]GHO49633.1 hypothetical protein KSX_77960 [Ktedonospora formicarum]